MERAKFICDKPRNEDGYFFKRRGMRFYIHMNWGQLQILRGSYSNYEMDLDTFELKNSGSWYYELMTIGTKKITHEKYQLMLPDIFRQNIGNVKVTCEHTEDLYKSCLVCVPEYEQE